MKLLKNCRIVQDGRLVRKNILIDSRIRKITGKEPSADEIIDMKGQIVLPGIIDPHVHFREPGLTHKEDFLSGSIAAAKGGITTVLDMPNTIPPTVTLKLLDEKRELAKKSIVNYGFHFGSSTYNLGQIKKARNVASVKVFMDESTGNMRISDEETILGIFKNSLITTVHAENRNVLKAIRLIKQTKNKLYLCHITTKDELGIIRKNKTKNIFAEATPHHLFLSFKEVDKLGALAKMKPMLKSRSDQAALWDGIKTGLIDTVGTDHAPHTLDEKKEAEPYGVPGVETMLPLLLDAVNKKRITLERVTELTSRNPARIFRIKSKGAIKPGYDADLTAVDLQHSQKVRADNLLAKCGWSPFEGKTLKGWPSMTIVNGNIVFDNGNVFEIRGKEVSYG